MFLSQRAQKGRPNILSFLSEKAKERQRNGLAVFNLSIGTPDLPPPPHVLQAVQEAALTPENYQYGIVDSPELIQAVQDWYVNRYGVKLDPEEISSIYGTQEGMAHIFFILCDPGDVVLLSTPLYPVFLAGVEMACCEPYFMPMLKENDYLIDFSAIPPEIAEKAKVLVVSYPNNPTTAVAPPQFYKELIAFGKKHNIFILHDNAYGELADPPVPSFLSYDGAKEIGVEFNSLSKTYNMTGARLSFVLGHRGVVAAFKTFRSQIDYGLFPVAEKGAIAALTGPQDVIEENRAAYSRRRQVLAQGLREIGWPVPVGEGTMFTWYPIPEGFTDDVEFATLLLDKAGVAGVPGSSFGAEGAGYIRFALVLPEEELVLAVKAIDQSGLLKGQ